MGSDLGLVGFAVNLEVPLYIVRVFILFLLSGVGRVVKYFELKLFGEVHFGSLAVGPDVIPEVSLCQAEKRLELKRAYCS